MTNIEVLGAIHGIAPRSDELHRLGTDLEKGRVSQETFDEQIAQESENWQQLQRDAGINIVSDGKFTWADHLRPIVKSSTGFGADVDNAPLTRWYDENRFYRQPSIISRLHLEDINNLNDVVAGNQHVSLLSPSTFADLCTDNFPDLPADRNVSQLYSDVLFNLELNGTKRVTFVDYKSKNATLTGDDAYQEIKQFCDWSPNIQFGLISPRSVDSVIPMVPKPNQSVQVAPITIRHLATHIPDYSRPKLEGAEIWQLVLDSSQTLEQSYPYQDTDIESLRTIKPARIVLTHTLDLELLPLTHAQKKVRQLGQWVYRLNEQLKEIR